MTKAHKSADSIAVLSQLHIFELGMLRESKQPPGSSPGLKFVETRTKLEMAIDMLIDSVDGRIAIPVLIWLSRDFATVTDTIASSRWLLDE